jgi:hypothetical protein
VRYQPAQGKLDERIHMAWTLAGGGPEGPSHDRYHKDVYYAYFKPANRHFYCVDDKGDKDLGFNLDKNNMYACLVEDTGPLDAKVPQAASYIQQLHYTDDGKPLLVYGLEDRDGITLRAARWNGSAWLFSDVTSNAAGLDIEKLGPESFALYVARMGVQTYISYDGGASWTRDASFTLPEGNTINSLVVLDNYRDPAQLLLTEKTDSLSPSGDIYLVGKARCLVSGTYRIKDAWGGNYLSLRPSGQAELRVLNPEDKSQTWVIKDEMGWCKLVNQADQGVLVVSSQERDTAAKVVSEGSVNIFAERWIITGTDDSRFKLRNAWSESYLRSSGGEVGSEARMIELKTEEDGSQRWWLEPLD